MKGAEYCKYVQKVSQHDVMLCFGVCDLRSQRLAGNKCMPPECCAAHHDMAHPDEEIMKQI